MTSESALLGPVVILGDFNAHLGNLGGARGVGDPNIQGIALHEVMDRCDLSAVSLGSMVTGPSYTNINGDTQTTVDYALANMDAISMTTTCHTLPMADLNTSDHLPLVIEMICGAGFDGASLPCPPPRIDWEQASTSGAIDVYREIIAKALVLLLTTVMIAWRILIT